MNFKNDAFDIVHTNATIEHVGSYQNQISLIRETVRVQKNMFLFKLLIDFIQ